jgi:hypothetical protein
MYTWVTRTALLCTLVLPALASCAGDDDDTGSAASAAKCMPGLMSTSFVGMPMDPCPQDMADPATGKIICPSAMGYMAVSQCMPDGKWQYPCQCLEKPAMCGDGKRTGQEACDGADLNGASCAKVLGGNATGTVTCSTTCTLVTTGCTSGPPPTGGNGG